MEPLPMATPAGQLIHILHNGAIVGGKTGATKKGGLGGRKALNDISNSRNPTVLQTKKDNSVNVVSTGKDVSASQTESVVWEKVNFSGAPDKGKVSGRKALGYLTNSVKPSSQQVPNKGQKLNPIAEENVPFAIKEERFLHNHQERIRGHIHIWPSPSRGLGSSSSKPNSPAKHLEMEEMPELLFEDQVSPGYSSPSWGSPKSPKLPFTN
ncbi:protein PATRONUS 1-like [Forsythia ovata]|uniref:Protein PATRONUS 1-like n=1 Tax=Forsythia ovata TaxID=205694 RepID=A0ABD1X6C6_9LAMI